jgi:nicotinamide mononucleotide adenylyltransferase
MITGGAIKTMDMEKEYGIFPGRFQPYHNGHHSTISIYLSSYEFPLIIGIIISTMPIDFTQNEITDFERDAEKHHIIDKNPFAFWERYEMICSVWANEIKNRRITLLPLPRPQGPRRWWQYVTEFLPPNRFWILPKSGDSFDVGKEKFFRSMGEKVLYLEQSVRVITGEEIRARLKKNEPIENFVPEGVVRIIRQKENR